MGNTTSGTPSAELPADLDEQIANELATMPQSPSWQLRRGSGPTR